MSLRHRRDERGAVGVLFAVLLGTGVFFGLVALTFDYGILNVNHSQLQSSADAAALRAAKVCATAPSGPAPATLDAISGANDSGSTHSSSVLSLCGRDAAAALPSCGNNSDLITLCPSISWAGNYVEVHTRKQTDHVFAGNGDGGSTQGQACAAVAWGRVRHHSGTIPITFSSCEWQAAVGGDPVAGTGGNYAPAPPYPPYPDPSYQHSILLETKTAGSCTTFNGHDAPGGFGWLTAGAGCTQTIGTGGWIQVDTGNSMPNGCNAQIQAMLGHIVDIPVYDCMNSTATMPTDPATGCSTGNGTHLWYHVAGFAGFYVTGWQLAGTIQNSIATGGAACGSGEKFIEGFFVKDIQGGVIGDPGDDPDFGLTAIQTIG
jgi:hypothetical protein